MFLSLTVSLHAKNLIIWKLFDIDLSFAVPTN